MSVTKYRRHLPRVEEVITEYMTRLKVARLFERTPDADRHEISLNRALDHWRAVKDVIITGEMEKEFR